VTYIIILITIEADRHTWVIMSVYILGSSYGDLGQPTQRVNRVGFDFKYSITFYFYFQQADPDV